MVVNTQRMRDPVLYLARVLRARINQPLVLLLRHHIRDLALEVEMLLSADLQRTRQRVPGAA